MEASLRSQVRAVGPTVPGYGRFGQQQQWQPLLVVAVLLQLLVEDCLERHITVRHK